MKFSEDKFQVLFFISENQLLKSHADFKAVHIKPLEFLENS